MANDRYKIDNDNWVHHGKHIFRGPVEGISGGGGGDVESVNGKTGVVVLTATDVNAATIAQGALAETAVQPGDLGTAASADTTDFATAAQGILADNAVQPENLSEVASSGSYTDLINIPASFTPSAHTHAAADINSGTLADARIPSLNASKINAGTFADARIPALAISKITNLQTTLNTKINSVQEGGVGNLVLNILTFPNGQLPDVGDRIPGTLYIEEEA